MLLEYIVCNLNCYQNCNLNKLHTVLPYTCILYLENRAFIRKNTCTDICTVIGSDIKIFASIHLFIEIIYILHNGLVFCSQQTCSVFTMGIYFVLNGHVLTCILHVHN